MAPVLFNLYTTLVLDRWRARLEESDDVGVTVNFKLDGKLFRRYTRNADQMSITECLFADDGALVSSSRASAERVTMEYQSTSTDFGLTVSIPKTKHLVVGRQACDADREPIQINGGIIESVDNFPYLGSVISSSGRIDDDIDARLAKASRAFGALRKAVFLDKNLKLETKRKVYEACVLSVLLYGSECWIMLRKHKRKIDSFHHRCIRIIQGITNHEQWTNHITMKEIRRRWGNDETASMMVTGRRLQWLGHIARMPDHRIPKALFFGWLSQPRPRSGPRKRWRDVIRADLKVINVNEDDWYRKALTSRSEWKYLCREGLRTYNAPSVELAAAARNVICEVCHRTFSRECDKKRHKCTAERLKPVSQQKGAVQCINCNKWHRSKGGLSVHVCRPNR